MSEHVLLSVSMALWDLPPEFESLFREKLRAKHGEEWTRDEELALCREWLIPAKTKYLREWDDGRETRMTKGDSQALVKIKRELSASGSTEWIAQNAMVPHSVAHDALRQTILYLEQIDPRSLPRFLQCTPASWKMATLEAVRTQLPIDGKHLTLIPYGERLRMLTNWKGFVLLASYEGWEITAGAIAQGDEYGYNEHVWVHPKNLDADRGDYRGAWCVAKRGDDRRQVVMTRQEIDARRACSQASGPDSPWERWPREMARKTCVLNLCRQLPLDPSRGLARALDHGEDGVAISAEPAPVFRPEPAPSTPANTENRDTDAAARSTEQDAEEHGAPAANEATDGDSTYITEGF